MKNPRLFIFAGEPSGDLHGGKLMKALREELPHLEFEGVGGPDMRFQGLSTCLNMEDFCVMGFTDVVKALPRLIRQFNLVKDHILKQQPPAVVLIDYPGFNLRLAKALRKHGFKGKIIQYISPTVWAWGKKRIASMEKTLDLLMTIYPFEVKCFEHTTLHAKFVGHPLAEGIKTHRYRNAWKHLLGIPESAAIVSLFPGSRPHEIERNLPTLLAAATLMSKHDKEAIFCLSYTSVQIKQQIEQIASHTDLPLYLIPKEYRYEQMRASQSAVAKSGTITLELALHKVPTVVIYKLSRLNRFIAKYIIGLKLPFYCIVNILNQQQTFPELIEKTCAPDLICSAWLDIHQAGDQRQHILESCQAMIHLLQTDHSNRNAAVAIKQELSW